MQQLCQCNGHAMSHMPPSRSIRSCMRPVCSFTHVCRTVVWSGNWVVGWMLGELWRWHHSTIKYGLFGLGPAGLGLYVFVSSSR